jgi:signal transduction histidine kinase
MATNARAEVGTSPASNGLVDSANAVNDLWRGHRNRYFLSSAKSISTWAIMGGLLAHTVFFISLWHGDFPRWRIFTAAAIIVLFMLAQNFAVRRLRDATDVEPTFIFINTVAGVVMATTVTLTGGMLSPAAPSLVLPAMLGLLFLGPSELSYRRALCNVGLIFVVAALPSTVTGPQLDHAHYVRGLLAVLVLDMHVLHMVLKRLTTASNLASGEMNNVREERVAEAEEQTRRLQSVAAKVAHELKNPLASIKGLCQLVARTPNHERTEERLTVAQAEIARMEHILAEYLSFARPLEDLRLQSIDAAAICRDVAGVLDGRAAQAGITIGLQTEPSAMTGDPRRLKEALLNLVGNALEATGHGGSIVIRARVIADDVVIEIVDNGRGIAPENLPRIGTSFFTTRSDGTGLGVVLASSAIAQHQGTLRYASEVGRGTTVTINLPRRSQIEESSPQAEAA